MEPEFSIDKLNEELKSIVTDEKDPIESLAKAVFKLEMAFNEVESAKILDEFLITAKIDSIIKLTYLFQKKQSKIRTDEFYLGIRDKMQSIKIDDLIRFFFKKEKSEIGYYVIYTYLIKNPELLTELMLMNIDFSVNAKI